MATRCPKTGKYNKFEPGDDGTLDTVVVCSQCGQELRYNYDGPIDDKDAEGVEADYQSWLEEVCLDAAEQHDEE